MWNQRNKTVSEVPVKEDGVKLIGETIDGQTITNIEWDGKIRVLRDYKATPEEIQGWKDKYMEVGLKKHPGQLLDSHDSEELYEKINELKEENVAN